MNPSGNWSSSKAKGRLGAHLRHLASFKDGGLGQVSEAAVWHDLRAWCGSITRLKARMVIGTPAVIVAVIMQPAKKDGEANTVH